MTQTHDVWRELVAAVHKLIKQLVLEALVGPQEGQSVSPDGAGGPRHGETRRLIVEALAASDHPLKATQLARRCGRSYSGSFREALHDLVESGEVIHCAEATYGLPSRRGGT